MSLDQAVRDRASAPGSRSALLDTVRSVKLQRTACKYDGAAIVQYGALVTDASVPHRNMLELSPPASTDRDLVPIIGIRCGDRAVVVGVAPDGVVFDRGEGNRCVNRTSSTQRAEYRHHCAGA